MPLQLNKPRTRATIRFVEYSGFNNGFGSFRFHSHHLEQYLLTIPEHKRFEIEIETTRDYRGMHASSSFLADSLAGSLGIPADRQTVSLYVVTPDGYNEHRFRAFVERVIRWLRATPKVGASGHYNS